MFAILKPQAALPHQFQEKLVHNAGGLKQILGSLSSKQRAGDLPQLRIHQFEQVVHGRGIAGSPITEK
jgi:hypothetical protein